MHCAAAAIRRFARGAEVPVALVTAQIPARFYSGVHRSADEPASRVRSSTAPPRVHGATHSRNPFKPEERPRGRPQARASASWRSTSPHAWALAAAAAAPASALRYSREHPQGRTLIAAKQPHTHAATVPDQARSIPACRSEGDLLRKGGPRARVSFVALRCPLAASLRPTRPEPFRIRSRRV